MLAVTNRAVSGIIWAGGGGNVTEMLQIPREAGYLGRRGTAAGAIPRQARVRPGCLRVRVIYIRARMRAGSWELQAGSYTRVGELEAASC